MPEVTNELMYELLRTMQSRLVGMDGKMDELKQEMQAIRTHMIGLQQDISGVHSILVRHEQRLDRIERRLELTDISLQ